MHNPTDISVIRDRHTGALTGPSGEREFQKYAHSDVERLLREVDNANQRAADAEVEAYKAHTDAAAAESHRDEAEDRAKLAEAKLAALVGGLPGDAA